MDAKQERVKPEFHFTKDDSPSDGGVAIGPEMPRLFGLAEDVDFFTKILRPVRKEQAGDPQPTNQTPEGTSPASTDIAPPVCIITARSLKDISPHHASCIQSKKYSIMGLGFVSEGDEVQQTRNDSTTSVDQVQQQMSTLLTGEAYVQTKIDEKLNPLTIFGFSFELYRAVEDFLDGGTGYLEVVRDNNDKIVGINWLPYEHVSAVILKDENNRSRLAYRYTGGMFSATQKFYSLFGKANKAWLYNHIYTSGGGAGLGIATTGGIQPQDISEVIPLMLPSNQSYYYGYPEWLAASTIVTLLSKALQYKSDFYTNRGVLAYILTLAGSLDEKVWNAICAKVQGTVGGGQNFRNLAIHMANEGSKVQVDKIASSDKTEMQFAKDAEVFAQHIVSAHRMPTVLANILMPGKLGAANETVQALISFQLLNVGPKQQIIQQILASTLGGKDGIDGLKPEDFRLRKITSQFNIQGLDTASRMREEAPGSGRDVRQGLKD